MSDFFAESGSKVGGRGGRPRTRDDKRICGAKDCITKLSRYNDHDVFCNAHRPKKFPRLRGHIVDKED